MLLRQTAVALATAAALAAAGTSTASAASAPPPGNPPATNCLPTAHTLKKDAPGYYDKAPELGTAFWFFMQSGTGTLPFAPATLAELKRNNIKVEAVCPVGPLKDGKGVWTPVGSIGYSNINFVNGRIWYPGGWKFTNTKTGRSHKVDGFWLHDFPFISKASANVYIDDSPVPHEIELAHYDTLEFYTDLINPRENQGEFTVGPKDWKFKLSEQYSKELRETVGADIKPGTHVITLEINASVFPGKQLPLKPGMEKDESARK
ncbi:hypothetical protein H9Y04_14120 [Streptomyces sp. TRM66268-LWL]|uniref:Uncharacterized protein n=1 Tax=Streptomyces polyasparticus TaxID=2767826 RepID=A0ABR7SDX6_9ACTN|nr:hypothetical protein [Streptomyces polyasparticus]MBC9713706.1 hypothetical protein [Streptomyces polyasparticus]